MQKRDTATPPTPTADGPTAAAPSDGYVCAFASICLLPLTRGVTRLDIDEQLQPRSTIRGTAGLDWRCRPGLYLQAQSRLVGSVRCGSPRDLCTACMMEPWCLRRSG
jgi:hypothetical protein